MESVFLETLFVPTAYARDTKEIIAWHVLYGLSWDGMA